MSSFTPGPWRCDGSTNGRFYGVSAYREGFRGVPIVVWRGLARPATAEGNANARLIAAAPDLYEALKIVNAATETVGAGAVILQITTADRQAIRAALRKAEAQS